MIDTHPVRRVLQVHTRYREAGGEDRAVQAERDLLTTGGVAVEQVIFDNAELQESRSLARDLRLALDAIWSRAAAQRVALAMASFRPDVVHVHNTFAAASASVYGAAGARGVPVVQTLHNYRFVCPAATLFRDGRPCHDCLHAPVPLPAVVHACVRGSRPQSAVAAATLGLHRATGTYRRRIDAYIALTEFQRDRVLEGGLDPERVHVIPNFLESDAGPGTGDRQGVLYVGRLAVEKGLEPLLAAAAIVPGQLEIVGDGPLRPAVERAAAAGIVRYLGQLSPAAVAARMRSALAIVVPSLWYEGFPMVVLEAYAAATPVIASRIGSLAEVVEDGLTGFHVEPRDPAALGTALRRALDDPAASEAMGRGARRRLDDRYRGPRHLEALLAIYRAAGGARRAAA